MRKILIIEDDPIVGEMLQMYLSEEGFEVKRVEDSEAGLLELETMQPDILILDLMLPGVNGAEFCQALRSISQVPILMISMKTEVAVRINALEAGADDYLCKPFSMKELKAKVSAMLRRSDMLPQLIESNKTIKPDVLISESEITINLQTRAFYVRGQHVETTFSEFEIMKVFLANRGKVFTREEFISLLRGFDSEVTDRAIDVHIVNLRKKIEVDPKKPKHIKTVWGVGYKFQ
jgi:DNA-binding response OmpR family regulator